MALVVTSPAKENASQHTLIINTYVYILGGGTSGLLLLRRCTTLLQSEPGIFTHATSFDDGSLFAKGLPAALKPIVAELPHSSRPHL